MSNWICIDFGTCNSAAAIEIDGAPKLVSPNNLPFFPTVACVLSKDNIVVGQSAEMFRTKCPEHFLQEFKLDIDKELDSVIIFKSRQEKWLDKEFWGRKDDLTSFIL